MLVNPSRQGRIYFCPNATGMLARSEVIGGFYPSPSADGLMEKGQRRKWRLLFSQASRLVRSSRNRRAFTASALTWARSPWSRHSTTSGPWVKPPCCKRDSTFAKFTLPVPGVISTCAPPRGPVNRKCPGIAFLYFDGVCFLVFTLHLRHLRNLRIPSPLRFLNGEAFIPPPKTSKSGTISGPEGQSGKFRFTLRAEEKTWTYKPE